MFGKLLQATRKVVSKLLGKENIQKAMNVEVLVSSKMSAKIDKWTRMYEDNPPWMNKDNGVKSIGLPSAIASELARLVTLEMKSEITGSERADALNEFYQKLMAQIRTETEYACVQRAGWSLSLMCWATKWRSIVFRQTICFQSSLWMASWCRVFLPTRR